MNDKITLLARGTWLLELWCKLNNVSPPQIVVHEGHCEFAVCAYYRDNQINIWPMDCARVSSSFRSWSYPGYVIDRTPYGVIQHELAHHIDGAEGPRGGELSHLWKRETGEDAITGYAPNDNEWFAEIFRVFVTNPDLLRLLRPKMYAKLIEKFPHRAQMASWRFILDEAGERWITATVNHIGKAEKNAKRLERVQQHLFGK